MKRVIIITVLIIQYLFIGILKIFLVVGIVLYYVPLDYISSYSMKIMVMRYYIIMVTVLIISLMQNPLL